MKAFLKHRYTSISAGAIAALLLGLSVLSPLPFTDSTRETSSALISLEIPCAFGQIEDMASQACFWPKLPETDPILRAALNDAAEARLQRVVTLIQDGQSKDGLNLLSPLLKQGHPRAQFLASELYRRGDVLPRDTRLSLEILQAAASQGDPSSQFALAKRLTEDCSSECPQIMEAIAFFEAASGAGYDKATEALAEIYYVGIGVAEDEQKALPFIMKAAEAGLSASQRVLAHLYSEGKVVERSPELSLKWNEKAAENGDFRAMARAGWMYLRGKGSDPDRIKGLGYLWIAAHAGDGRAQCFLGAGMLNGWFDISDRLSGLMWLKLAAETDKTCAEQILHKHYAALSAAEGALTEQMVERCRALKECGSKPWEWGSVQG